ncbi:hypothetical protein HPP92_014238 [Vanilla planifolia]|uniref:Cytochrome P450 n=1 Tax=Vanilla planifolia TaxID=51239 RepID=A0A835UX86_VANPL|nr:hypothetical protein HPP92_014238 [Vanilla planifolia]
MLSAGSETSALTLEWALALLLRNPAAFAKARAEIEVNVGCRRITESDLSNLPYLHAVIEETLRLQPVAPLLPAHESAEDCVVGGFDVPRGTLLLVNVWAIHRDAAVWEDAEAFRPERWLEKEKQGGERLLSFGMGRRRCPGDGMAMRVVGLALGALLQCFDWEVGGAMEKVDLSEGPGLSMPMAKPLRARCRPNQLLKDLFGLVNSKKCQEELVIKIVVTLWELAMTEDFILTTKRRMSGRAKMTEREEKQGEYISNNMKAGSETGGYEGIEVGTKWLELTLEFAGLGRASKRSQERKRSCKEELSVPENDVELVCSCIQTA